MSFLQHVINLKRFSHRLRAPNLTVGRSLSWVFGLALLSPIFFIFGGVLTGATGESWSHIRGYLLPEALKNTLILISGTSLLVLLLGVPPAWLIARYQFPGRSLLSILLVLPLAVPPYIAAYLTTDLREALIPWLVEVRLKDGVERYLLLEKNLRFGWLILILSLTLYPYCFLSVRAALSRHASTLGEASRLLGVSPWRTIFSIHLPLLRPALVAGLFLCSMEVISDYGAAKYFGINTVTLVIFRTWFSLDELVSARYLAGWVLLTIFILVYLERLQRGRAQFTTRSAHPPRTRIRGPFRCILAILICGFPIILGFGYPLFKLVSWSLIDTTSQAWLHFRRPFTHSLSLGLGATSTCLIFSLLILTTARFTQKRADKHFSALLQTGGYATPGTIMAVGILGVASFVRSVPFLAQSPLDQLLLSGSFLWISFALTSRYLTVTSQVLHSGFQAIPLSWDQAARLLNRSPLAVLFTIHLPLLRGPLLSAGVLTFVDISKELPLTLLLRPFDFETLGTTAYSFANQGQIYACAKPALLLILLSAAGLSLVEGFGWKHKRPYNQNG